MPAVEAGLPLPLAFAEPLLQIQRPHKGSFSAAGGAGLLHPGQAYQLVIRKIQVGGVLTSINKAGYGALKPK